MFITFEGIEGSGKTTLMHGIAQSIRAAGRDVVETREPGGTQTGDRIRAIFLEPDLQIAPLAEALLLNASRVHLITEVIEPALSAGQVVLCDRFIDSTLAYQGYGRGLDIEMLRQMCDAATGGRNPDLTLFVDIPVALSRARVALRQRENGGTRDRLDLQDDAFHERVRAGFLSLAKENLKRIHVLDGGTPVDKLLAQALEEVRVVSK